MKRIIFGAIFFFIYSICVTAQTSEKFDIATFTPPTGWEKEIKEGLVAYTTTQSGGYCIISVFNSQTSSGDVKTDFNTRWNETAVQTFKVTDAPVFSQVQTSDGWNILLGTANFKNQLGPASFFVQTFSGNNKTLSVVAVSNSKDYLPLIGKFLASINLGKPSDLKNANSQLIQSSTVSGSGSSGITKLRTSFSDGWAATVEDDYVLVNKGNTNVYLFYGIGFNDESRRDTNKYYWQTVVVPRFKIQSSKELEQDSSNFFRTDFVEGTGTDEQTGQFCYIGMQVITQAVESGVAKVIVAAAPDKHSYYSQFPSPDVLGNMLSSNLFELTSNDVFGYWKHSSSEGLSFYHGDTGNYAGMKTVVNSNEFTFNSNGTYQNSHAGGTYNLETLDVSQSKNDGQFTVGTWEMTITDTQGETTIYDAYFEADASFT